MMLVPLLVALALMILVMACAWLTQRIWHNGGWVDVFWTYGTGLMGVFLSVWPPSRRR